MFSASVNKPCNSSTVVDHGMFPTKRRLDCGCSVDMCCSFCACFSSLFSKKKVRPAIRLAARKGKVAFFLRLGFLVVFVNPKQHFFYFVFLSRSFARLLDTFLDSFFLRSLSHLSSLARKKNSEERRRERCCSECS